jgi:NAD(P)-dependent dehydrogenase (short-subunit alcohol dehydrogenase family)
MGILEDKIVVVAGVGPGLGRSIAVQAAKAGADVVLAARTESRLADVADEIKQLGRRTVQVGTDINSEESAQNLVDTTLAEFGRIDALVNNAFAIPPLGDLATVDLDQVRAGFETNVLGALRLTRLFAPALAESTGSVVMINSSVLRHSSQPYGAYKMAKSALLAMSQSLATELGEQGIMVNSVLPGYIWGGTLKGYFEHQAGKYGTTVDDIYKAAAVNSDLKRLPTEDEVASAILFMASDLSSGITGQALDVNCGEYKA